MPGMLQLQNDVIIIDFCFNLLFDLIKTKDL